ncbi:MAG: class I SAM-dependent methyltransferase [Nocardioidaceae bacterium]
MNRFHRRYCASRGWAQHVRDDLLPWALQGVRLGDDVLEVGPGLGVTTRELAPAVPHLTVLEIDNRFVAGLREEFEPEVEVRQGDGAGMPLPDAGFSGAVCFTMLHHVPSAERQDALFAEVHRVLRTGGVFAGSDSQPSLKFKLIHLFDTMVVIDPATLPRRLTDAGFAEVRVDTSANGVRFAATKA